MKTIYLLVMIVVLGLSVSAQSKALVPDCTLKISDLPPVRELQLGMHESKALEIIGGDFRPDILEPRKRSASVYVDNRMGWENVKFISVDTIDYRVSGFTLTYDIKWKSLTEFAQNFAPKLNLPLTGWRYSGYNGASLRCVDFDVMLDSYLSMLTVTDRSASERLASERSQQEEAKKKVIKP